MFVVKISLSKRNAPSSPVQPRGIRDENRETSQMEVVAEEYSVYLTVVICEFSNIVLHQAMREGMGKGRKD